MFNIKKNLTVVSMGILFTLSFSEASYASIVQDMEKEINVVSAEDTNEEESIEGITALVQSAYMD